MDKDHPLTLAAKILEEECLPYCIIGAYAVAIHGEPRATYDIDFLVLATREDLRKLFRRCSDAGWNCELRTADATDPVGDVLRVYSPFACDFLRARPGLEADCVERSIPLNLFSQEIRVARAEHTILLLLRAGDPGVFTTRWLFSVS